MSNDTKSPRQCFAKFCAAEPTPDLKTKVSNRFRFRIRNKVAAPLRLPPVEEDGSRIRPPSPGTVPATGELEEFGVYDPSSVSDNGSLEYDFVSTYSHDSILNTLDGGLTSVSRAAESSSDKLTTPTHTSLSILRINIQVAVSPCTPVK